jgi:hypothetical protein
MSDDDEQPDDDQPTMTDDDPQERREKRGHHGHRAPILSRALPTAAVKNTEHQCRPNHPL